MIRVEVDDLHEGHAEQQRLVAALPQQQASCNERKLSVLKSNHYVVFESPKKLFSRGFSYLPSSTYT